MYLVSRNKMLLLIN